jgi:hypothetical protein
MKSSIGSQKYKRILVETINGYPLVILYINSLRLSTTEVLGAGGRERPGTRGDPCQSVTGCRFRVTMHMTVLFLDPD